MNYKKEKEKKLRLQLKKLHDELITPCCTRMCLCLAIPQAEVARACVQQMAQAGPVCCLGRPVCCLAAQERQGSLVCMPAAASLCRRCRFKSCLATGIACLRILNLWVPIFSQHIQLRPLERTQAVPDLTLSIFCAFDLHNHGADGSGRGGGLCPPQLSSLTQVLTAGNSGGAPVLPCHLKTAF